MFKKSILVVIALILLVPASLCLGCSDDDAEVTWTLTTHTDVGDIRTQIYNDFAQLVNDKTDGRMEIKIATGGALYSGDQVFEAVSEGEVVQMGACASSWYFGTMQKVSVAFSYASMWTADYWEMAKIQKALTEQMQSLKDEAAEYDIMHTLWLPGGAVEFFFDREVETMDDVSGLKIRSFGSTGSKILEALGAAPVTLDTAEIYLAAQKGTVDGAAAPFETYMSARLFEVLPYVVITDTLPATYSTIMNKGAFEALDPEFQAAILEAADELAEQVFLDYAAEHEAELQQLEDEGAHIYYLTEDERTKWLDEAIMPVMDGLLNKFVGDDAAEAHQIANAVLAAS